MSYGFNTPKTPVCPLGPKHKYAFVRNDKKFSMSPVRASISVVGVYRCDCGLAKLGRANPNAAGSSI